MGSLWRGFKRTRSDLHFKKSILAALWRRGWRGQNCLQHTRSKATFVIPDGDEALLGRDSAGEMKRGGTFGGVNSNSSGSWTEFAMEIGRKRCQGWFLDFCHIQEDEWECHSGQEECRRVPDFKGKIRSPRWDRLSLRCRQGNYVRAMQPSNVISCKHVQHMR